MALHKKRGASSEALSFKQGLISAKEFYVKTKAEAQQFMYHYYLGEQLRPVVEESYLRKVDLSQLQGQGIKEITLFDDVFDGYGESVDVYSKHKKYSYVFVCSLPLSTRDLQTVSQRSTGPDQQQLAPVEDQPSTRNAGVRLPRSSRSLQLSKQVS